MLKSIKRQLKKKIALTIPLISCSSKRFRANTLSSCPFFRAVCRVPY